MSLNYLTASIPIQEPHHLSHENCQKHRWRPTQSEFTELRTHFESNPFPSKEEKQSIIHTLQKEFDSQAKTNHLDRWFQNQRKRSSNQYVKSVSKSRYNKFSKTQLTELLSNFEKRNYPKAEEMEAIAQQLNVTVSKIENWYKYNRRSLAKQGSLSLKTKKYFKKEELSYLSEFFEKNSCPNKLQVLSMAEKLGCHEIQIKNWFSNRRKKSKRLVNNNNFPLSNDNVEENNSGLSSKINLTSEEDRLLFSQPVGPSKVSQGESMFPLLPESVFLKAKSNRVCPRPEMKVTQDTELLVPFKLSPKVLNKNSSVLGLSGSNDQDYRRSLGLSSFRCHSFLPENLICLSIPKFATEITLGNAVSTGQNQYLIRFIEQGLNPVWISTPNHSTILINNQAPVLGYLANPSAQIIQASKGSSTINQSYFGNCIKYLPAI